MAPLAHTLRPALKTGRGENDRTAPGRCVFHPYLARGSGPFVHGAEWRACRAEGHTPDAPGCYSRAHVHPNR